MIQVHRPAAVPGVLAMQGVPARQAFCAAYEAKRTDYDSGAEKFTFDAEIYGAEEVKSVLRSAQHDKCCFCKSKVPHISPGDIEHFRPKAAVRERPDGPLLRPGYYWLAYEWTNLFFCCEICNRRGKKNYFPLRRNRVRARSHRSSVHAEKPLFVNPEEDPTPHLGFREEIVFPRSKRGEITRDALCLNRNELVERRRRHLEIVKVVLQCHRTFVKQLRKARAGAMYADVTQRVAEIERFFKAQTQDTAEYAAMTRAYLRAKRFHFTTS